jgi:ActR/RegA family two-component response regulator
MQHPQTFLLEKIINSDNNGLETLGKLNTVHVKDLVVVLTEFGEATALEPVERLVEGETVFLSDGRSVCLEPTKKKGKKRRLC